MLHTSAEEQAREIQRQYLREWRRKNKDKVRKYNEAYWKRKAQQMRVTESEVCNDTVPENP